MDHRLQHTLWQRPHQQNQHQLEQENHQLRMYLCIQYVGSSLKAISGRRKGPQIHQVDNEIRKLYAEKDLFLNIDKGLFALPLVRILARTTSTKQAHLVGMQAAKVRWEDSIDTNNLESVINPTHCTAIEEKIKKRQKKEKAHRKKDDKRKKIRTQQKHPEKQDLTTRLTQSQITHSHTLPKHHQPQSPYHKQHTTLYFVWTSSPRPYRRTLNNLEICYIFIFLFISYEDTEEVLE
jgi:hypothetical protein